MIVTLKGNSEIEGFKEAGRIAGLILGHLLDSLSVGVVPTDIDDLARELCKKHNVIPTFLGYLGFPAAICFSKNNVMVHGIPDSTPLKEGDLVTVDFGATLDGFIGDTADTVRLSKQATLIENCCSEALYDAISCSIAGNRLSDIGKTITKIATDNKYSIPINYGGHGIDRYYLHSPPFVANLQDVDDITLTNGMIFAIEPMFIDSESNNTKIAVDNWSVVADGETVHCEHTILINDDRPIILTNRRKDA